MKVDGEEAKSYELGVKTDLLERRLRVNGAVFYVDYGQRIVGVPGSRVHDQPIPTGTDPPIYNTVPAGTAGSVTDTLGNICLSSNTTSRTFYQNFPGKIKGAELEVAFRPIDPLTINASYGYTGLQRPTTSMPRTSSSICRRMCRSTTGVSRRSTSSASAVVRRSRRASTCTGRARSAPASRRSRRARAATSS